MRIGTMFLGEVERVDHESIQTKFFVLGVPLVPLESFYMTSTTMNGGTGVPIPLHGASVLAGYARFALFAAAVFSGLFFFIEHSEWDPSWGLLTVCIASTLAWALSVFWFGRLSDEEKERRRVRRTLTGLGAPAAILDEATRVSTVLHLEKVWKAISPEKSWREQSFASKLDAKERVVLEALKEFDGGAQGEPSAVASDALAE